jgi:hypothetical protein
MEEQLSFHHTEQYLHLTIKGNFKDINFKTIPNAIALECTKNLSTSVLINGLAVKNANLSTMDRFALGEKIIELFGSRVKFAIAWPKEDITKFAETVIENRGGNAKVFDNLADAEAWIILP